MNAKAIELQPTSQDIQNAFRSENLIDLEFEEFDASVKVFHQLSIWDKEREFNTRSQTESNQQIN